MGKLLIKIGILFGVCLLVGGGVGIYYLIAQPILIHENPTGEIEPVEIPEAKYIKFNLYGINGIGTPLWNPSDLTISIVLAETEVLTYSAVNKTMTVNLAIRLSLPESLADQHTGVRVWRENSREINIYLIGILCGERSIMQAYIPKVDNGVLISGIYQTMNFDSVTTSQSRDVIDGSATVIVPMQLSW